MKKYYIVTRKDYKGRVCMWNDLFPTRKDAKLFIEEVAEVGEIQRDKYWNLKTVKIHEIRR